ncbi:Ribosome biogenesis protein ERB1 [Neolecta irregularis DAH-3]|uniref:Ribosome biogenesis protein ERB1 n=1 Tax=Neolecta irregularis (strain DAH-3) TaxID=1198029 RepID=A0A1U7LLH9_NEOID|nr:Ribosome biogenesis protein ERB1 [Neolecta irregularis DAH-3]|eukprot:OLL23371.1 Ribosome biogenesis protein ERB1 [Neolecta irregularis DAH-3]
MSNSIAAVDSLLESIQKPEGWTGLTDEYTGQDLVLTKEELDVVRRVIQGGITDEQYDPYQDQVEYFSGVLEQMPLSSAPEPKRRFIPSKYEAKMVMKIVRAIREGRIIPKKAETSNTPVFFDIWADDAPQRPNHVMHIPAPKLLLPTHDESYNPPAEYLPTEEKRLAWKEMDPEDREQDYLPQKYSSLRLVPGYVPFLNEKFERCLDLYLAPRVRRKKLNIDPESLVPKLPSPKDLRPFPTRCSTTYKGHDGRVRSISCDPSGIWLATGGDDGTVRIWEIITGRELWKWTSPTSSEGDAVNAVEWSPVKDSKILAVAAGDNAYIIIPPVFHKEDEAVAREIACAGRNVPPPEKKRKSPTATWVNPTTKQDMEGLCAIINTGRVIKQIAWHRRGDYFSTVAPGGSSSTVFIHQLSKYQSQAPFRKSKGPIQKVAFHPIKPYIYVATQRNIRIYNLAKQELIKNLQCGVRWISSLDIHIGGDNVVVGSYDKRLVWFDTDLSTKPYKSLRYHQRAIRDVQYHKGGLPLFCSASDDGSIHVFHGMVYNDLMENPLIVPLKKLIGHDVVESLGVLSIDWHPKQPWLFSAGADGMGRLWVH